MDNQIKTKHGGKRPGSGAQQKYGESTLLVAFRVPLTLHNQLLAYAAQHNISKSQAIVKLLKSSIK